MPDIKIALELLKIDDSLTDDQLEGIGKEYIRTHLAPHDEWSHLLPFCQTSDGKEVYFKGTAYHILRKDTGKALRAIEKSRVERLHWIIPILKNSASQLTLQREGDGAELGYGFKAGKRYRLYWLPKLNYFIILYFEKRSRFLILLTAYWVTEPQTRKMLFELFPKNKKPAEL